MQLRHVGYFVALARERHFRRAAEASGVSQPTLSAGVAALESALGARLVVRERRFVALTPEGEAALPWAQRMLADHDGLTEAASGADRPLAGPVTIGVIPAAAPVVGALVGALGVRHPALEPRILSMTSREIERGLLARELTGGLTYLDNEPVRGVVGTPFYDEHYRFATPSEGPLADRSSVTWAQAAASPLCLLTPDMQNRRILQAQLRAAGVEVTPRATANSYAGLLSMVRHGGLSSILPHVHARAALLDPGIRVIPFDRPTRPQAVGLVVPDTHPMGALARALLLTARSPEMRRRLAAFEP